MLRILLTSAALILLIALFLSVIKLYIRKFVRKGRVIAVFVPPPEECVIYGLQFQVIGDLQMSINREGMSKKDDRMLYAARPLEGNVYNTLNASITITQEDSIVVRRHFGTGTIVGFAPLYRPVSPSAHDEFVEEAVNS